MANNFLITIKTLIFSSFIVVPVFTEAYYYVSMEDYTEIPGLQVSKEIDYNKFSPTACNSACDEECKQLRANGDIPPATEEELNHVAAEGTEIWLGMCFCRIGDGLENVAANRDVFCGCIPSYPDPV